MAKLKKCQNMICVLCRQEVTISRAGISRFLRTGKTGLTG